MAATSRPVGRVVGAVLLALAFLLEPAVALAQSKAKPSPQPSASPDAEKAKEEDEAHQRLIAALIALRTRLSVVQTELLDLDARYAKVQEEVTETRWALFRARNELMRRKRQLTSAQARLRRQRALLKSSVTDIYIRGPWADIDARLNAKDMTSLHAVEVYSSTALVNFVEILRRIERLKARVTVLHRTVRKRTIQLNAKMRDVLRRRAALEAQQRRASRLRDNLIGELTRLGGPILRSFRMGSANIRRLFANAQRRQEELEKGRVPLEWPIRGRISSDYGPRIHPIFHYRSYHTGVDISSPHGRAIRTAAPGRVIAAEYLGAFGLTVLVDHGHKTGTMYSHLSSTSVRPGDVLEERDFVGRIGCTGWCTGPHLHFEVWFRTRPTDPVKWVSSS